MSSLKDDASLILIPSLYKDGRLDTVKPLGNSIVHPDATGNHDGTDGSTLPEANFTFSRGSNLAATRVDVNGLIEKGRENLLLQSNQFDTTWVQSGATLTGNQTGYDGSNDAWLLTKNAAFGRLDQTISSSGVQTYSIYAKANDSNWIYFRADYSGGVASGYFDLVNGVGGSFGNTIDSDITSVGNGWYRMQIVFDKTTTIVRIYPAEDNNQSGGTSGSIYIQDAQLESGLVATDYIETGTSAAQSGILEDMPRLDYSGGASCPSLLLEPSRTNQVQNSEYYESYALNSVSISSNATTSPEGLQNAAELIEDSSNDNHFFRIPNLSWTSGTDVVFSIYLKENTRRYARLRFDNTGANTRAWLDLRTGETTFIDAGLENGVCTSVDYGNGWFKYDFKITAQNTGTGSVQVFTQSVESVTGSLQTTYQGDGTSGIYVWGAQVETGSYPTSYIPTYGSSVTRSVDSCANTSATNIINQDEGTLFVDFIWNGKQDNIDYYHMAIIDSYAQNEIRLGGYNLALYGRVYSGGTLTFAENYSFGASLGGRYKVIIKYGSEGVKTFANGQLMDSGTPTLPIGTMDEIRLTRSGVGTHSAINQSLYFPTALTDSECIALTTL